MEIRGNDCYSKWQPVIHRQEEDSPLHGLVQRLDIIVGDDKADTSYTSAMKVTVLMAKRI